MHEYSVIQALMGRVEAEASARQAVAVHRVRIRIGEVSGIEPDLLVTAFDMVRGEGICRAARLEIERVAARWGCPQCGGTIRLGDVLQCPDCSRPAALLAGDEIMLDQIELEVA